MIDKYCAQCGELLTRNQAAYCSKICFSNSHKVNAVPHNCKFCDKPIVKRIDEYTHQFNDRKYCNADCRTNFIEKRIRETLLHPCQQCGKTIQKKRYESVNRYNSRKYCSTTCAKKYMKEHEQGWFAHGYQTINKEKKKDAWDKDLPPLLWTDQDFKDFYNQYPELSQF